MQQDKYRGILYSVFSSYLGFIHSWTETKVFMSEDIDFQLIFRE